MRPLAIRCAVLAALAVALLMATGCSGGSQELRAPEALLPTVQGDAPRLAQVWLVHDDFDPEALARFDLVIVDMEWTHRDPAGLRRIRRLNPGVELLAYVGSQEIMDPETLAKVSDGFRFRRSIAAGIDDSWYLRDGAGEVAVFYPGTWMVNPTTGWIPYLARFVSENVVESGLFDGVYYDNAWASPSWLEGGDVDLDQSGRADGEEHGNRWIGETWNDAIVRLFEETRARHPDITLMGNGSAATYEDFDDYAPRHHEGLNGALDEHWPTLNSSWAAAIRRIEGWLLRARDPGVFLIQADPDRADDPLADLRGFRFAFASGLITGSHVAYNRGDHGQDDWWYDEYDAVTEGRGYLGRPTGPRRPLGDGVWAREFERGLAVVNPAEEPRTVTLEGGPWRFIEGEQDREANPGGPATEVTLDGRDGRVLLRAPSGGPPATTGAS
jgi:hypothetical protein